MPADLIEYTTANLLGALREAAAALGGWAAGLGALIAGAYVWDVWQQQRAMALHDRNAEAVMLEAYFATDLIVWHDDLVDVAKLAATARNDHISDYSRMIERIKTIDVRAFREQLPSLWRMADDFGPAIAMALSATQRVVEMAKLPVPSSRRHGYLAEQAAAFETLTKGALLPLQRPRDRLHERWAKKPLLPPATPSAPV